jgi:adenosylcobinamide amidohydrolase
MPRSLAILTHRSESGRDLPMLVWRFPQPVRAIASGPLGGGIGSCRWVVNATVDRNYDRVDPDAHLRELAGALGLVGPGAGLLTAVDVGDAVTTEDGGVVVVATVGLGHPTLAAAPDAAGAPGPVHAPDLAPSDGIRPGGIGTINIVALIPVALGDAALVNAVATATEAKVQALWEYGVVATGTASDALFVGSVTPGTGPVEAFGGPRSTWGARLARAVHAAVRTGTERWFGPTDPSRL